MEGQSLMEKKGARLFQEGDVSLERNIVELDSRRQLRLKANELIRLVNDPTLTTSEIQEQLSHGAAMYGSLFAAQLVRCLHRDDPQERQSVVWLLTILNDEAAIPLLLRLSRDMQAPRSVRLSASLALAGMGVTPALVEASGRRPRLYAIS
jgi:HEAT repeat protein